jgi:hypothetical protein
MAWITEGGRYELNRLAHDSDRAMRLGRERVSLLRADSIVSQAP